MICRQSATATKEFLSMRSVQIQVGRETTPHFIDVCSSLIKCERKECHLNDNSFCFCKMFFRCLIQECIWSKELCSAEEEKCPIDHSHILNVDPLRIWEWSMGHFPYPQRIDVEDMGMVDGTLFLLRQ